MCVGHRFNDRFPTTTIFIVFYFYQKCNLPRPQKTVLNRKKNFNRKPDECERATEQAVNRKQ